MVGGGVGVAVVAAEAVPLREQSANSAVRAVVRRVEVDVEIVVILELIAIHVPTKSGGTS